MSVHFLVKSSTSRLVPTLYYTLVNYNDYQQTNIHEFQYAFAHKNIIKDNIIINLFLTSLTYNSNFNKFYIL